MRVSQVSEIRENSIERTWPQNEPRGEPPPARTAFDVLLAVCGRFDDPEFHDGWQPVRARNEAPKTE